MVAVASNKFAAEDLAARMALGGGALSVAFWMLVRLAGNSGAGRMLALGLFLCLAGLAAWSALHRRYAACCCALAYLTAVEPATRGYAKKLPYLSLEYLILLIAVLVVLQRRASLRLPTLLLSLYFLLEAIGLAASANGEDGRWMVVMTGARLGLFLLLLRSRLGVPETVAILGAYVAGTLAMASMGLHGAFSSVTEWTEQSNASAAGGFGPNQVAGLLALGAFASVFLADLDRRWWARLAYLALCGVQVLSALLTFTRGGSVILALGLMLYVSMLLACGRVSVAVAGLAVVVVGVAWLALQVTDQVLLARYQDTSMSGREGIWALGLRIFWDQPVFGVGTGNFYEASQGRLATYHGRVGSHNELIRALSEHGLVGATLWLSFVGACVARCWQEQRGLARAASLSWLMMAVAFECHSGLKLAMSMFFMALAVEGFRHVPPPLRGSPAWQHHHLPVYRPGPTRSARLARRSG